MKSIVTGLGVSLAILGFTTRALAFQVKPALLEIELKKGEKGSVTLDLTGTKDYEGVILYVQDYYIAQEGGVKFDAPDDAFSAKNWIKPKVPLARIESKNTKGETQEQFLPVVFLNKDQVKPVAIEINPPLEAVGEYYATVHFRDFQPTMQKVEGKTGQVAVYFAVAARINIKITGANWRTELCQLRFFSSFPV